MENYEERVQQTYKAALGTGWAAYAGLLLLASGAFDVIGGIALLAKNNHLASGLFWGRPFWGVVFLVIGGVMLYAGFALRTKLPGSRRSRSSSRSIDGELPPLWAAGGAPANTTWVLVGIAVDLLILYGLVAPERAGLAAVGSRFEGDPFEGPLAVSGVTLIDAQERACQRRRPRRTRSRHGARSAPLSRRPGRRVRW